MTRTARRQIAANAARNRDVYGVHRSGRVARGRYTADEAAKMRAVIEMVKRAR